MNAEIIEAAVHYAEKFGWWVFPTRGKIPATPHGFKDAQNAPDKVRELFGKHQGDGVALWTGKQSGVFALDIDVKNEAGGDHSLSELEGTHGQMPETVQQITPSNGIHYLFKYPKDGIGSNAGVIAKGVDLRGDGGYICLAPSPGYEWEISHHPDEVAIVDAPDWLLKLSKKEKKDVDLTKDTTKITENRNEALTKIAGNFRRNGLELEELYSALSGVNSRKCSPPLDEQEVRKIANSVGRYKPVLPTGAYTDHWAAKLFKEKYGQDLHWCDSLGGWLLWDETRWLRDDVLRIESLAANVIQQMHDQANISDDKKLKAFAIRRENDSQFRTMISRLRALEGIPARSGEFDTDTTLINLLNGTWDLRSSKLRPHDRADKITRRLEVRYNPDAKAPRWEKFLDEIFKGDKELISYMQRAIGYSLTGDVSEHCMFVLYGMGRNGKSTLLKHVSAIMGDYASSASAGLLIEKREEGIPNDIARLRGVRAVMVQESKRSNSFDEARVKSLTGGDRITARFLNKEFFEFNPTFKIFLATNHKPEVAGTDIGIWRRIRPIPFTRVFTDEEADKDLDRKLESEYEGILLWMLEGSRMWQKEGLGENKAVTEAIATYQEESDVMGLFIEEVCDVEPNLSVTVKDLREAVAAWTKTSRIRSIRLNEINEYLEKKRQLQKVKANSGTRQWCWNGIALKSNWSVLVGPTSAGGAFDSNPGDARPY